MFKNILLAVLVLLTFTGCYDRNPRYGYGLNYSNPIPIYPFSPTPCIPPANYDEKTFKQLEDIILKKTKFTATFTADLTYWLPTRDWVFAIVVPHMKEFLLDERITYQSKFDCDDFARTFTVIAQLDYVHKMPDERMQGIAIAEMAYHPDPSAFSDGSAASHAINVIVINTGEVMFLEPQTGLQLVLTETEIRSIYMIKF